MARTRRPVTGTGSSTARPRAARKSSGDAPSRRAAATTGDDAGALALAGRVAESLRRLRRERGLSLDQLAELSGVSRAALSQIEGARTNPSLGILWKAATGLGVPFHVLLGEETQARQAHRTRARDAIAVRSADGMLDSRLLSPLDASSRIEVYELRFASHGALRSDPHAAGTSETVVVLAGALRVIVGGETHELERGDSLFFRADVAHAYENPGAGEARCLDIVAYGPADR
jgi:XRE family transcriptional regulator, regulator of sulfur utilization